MAEGEEKGQTEVRHGARWPGLVLSLVVPGFGLFRAGKIGRGIAWIVGLQLSSLVVACAAAFEFVPLWGAIAVFLCALGVGVWMWCDSFRAGRMTWKLWVLFVALLALLAVTPTLGHLVARAFKVPTGAMEPTLMGTYDGSTPDHVIVNKLSYLFGSPKRGDLLVFATSNSSGIRFPERTADSEIYYIKRIVGMPGETIEIREGGIYADGRRLGEADGLPPIPYGPVKMFGATKGNGSPYVVGGNEYFVMGDHFKNSSDSRSWGGVPKENVYGKVARIYYPFSRMGMPRYPEGRE